MVPRKDNLHRVGALVKANKVLRGGIISRLSGERLVAAVFRVEKEENSGLPKSFFKEGKEVKPQDSFRIILDRIFILQVVLNFIKESHLHRMDTRDMMGIRETMSNSTTRISILFNNLTRSIPTALLIEVLKGLKPPHSHHKV